MASGNPFNQIWEPVKVEKNPFDSLAAGISPEAPVDINPFDAIGYEAPPEPVYNKMGDYMGAEILQGEGGKWYSKSEEGLQELPEDVKAKVGAEIGGLEEPWIDPTMVGAGAFGAAGKMALKAGLKVAAKRASIAAPIAAAAEYPIGATTEVVGERYPKAALPFNIALGVLSGITIERAIEKGIVKQFSKSTPKMVAKYKKALSEGDYTIPKAKEVEESLGAEMQRVEGKPIEGVDVKLEVNAFDAIIKEEPTPTMPKVEKVAPVPPKAPLKPEIEEVIPKIKPIEGDVAAGGLAHGMPLPKYASSINLERVGADYDTKKMMLDISDRYKGTIDEARRGKISHEETRGLADDLGMTEKKLLKRRKGRAYNAEEALAARDILNTSAGNLVDLQKKIVADPTDENMALFKMATERHAAIQAEVSGVATEAGRALSAHRIQSAKDARVAKNYKKMLEVLGKGDATDIDTMARYFGTIDATDQTAVNKFIMEMTESTTSDKVFEAWINGLLSGPQTHVVNTTSNTLTFLSKMPERATGITLDLMRAGITGTPRERFYGELPQNIYGGWQGMKEGVRSGLKAFATEIPTEDAMKLEMPRRMSIKGKKGRIVRIPGRALMAMDEFFKAINYRSELHSLAFRQTVKEGLKGKARANRIAEIVMSPSDELKGKATEEMLYRVFQKELGPAGKSLTKLRTEFSPLKWIVPFLKTPTNIAKFGIERTPLSLFRYPGMFKQLMRGDIKGSDINDEMAKTIMGSMIGAATFMYAKEGSITGGGPKNKAERDALYRTGWQPYSIKIGDKYYSYGRLEPLGMIMGTAADASEIWDDMGEEEQENVAALISLSVAKNLTSKTFMKGLSDVLNATSDPTRYGAKWVQNFAGSVVPSIVAATARAVDPELKEVRSIMDKLKSRTPSLAGELLPKRDVWGDPIKRDISGLPGMVTPVYVSKIKGTKVDREISRLGIRIGKPSRRRGKDGTEMSPKEYDEFIKEGGSLAKKRITTYVEGSGYEEHSDEFKEKRIKSLYENSFKITSTRRKIRKNKGE